MNLIWHKIADNISELSLSPEGLTELEVSGKKICLALYRNVLYATAAKCPHAGGSLANGYIDVSGNITCPLHRYKFSLDKGRNVSGEGYFLKTYPVEQQEDGIYVGFAVGMFGWLK